MSEEPSKLVFAIVTIVWLLFLVGILGQAPQPTDTPKDNEPKTNDTIQTNH